MSVCDYFGRLLTAYVIMVSGFAGAMLLAANRAVSFDVILAVFVLSITSFHGCGVQPPGPTMTDTLTSHLRMLAQVMNPNYHPAARAGRFCRLGRLSADLSASHFLPAILVTFSLPA